jgi:hypothetical protein
MSAGFASQPGLALRLRREAQRVAGQHVQLGELADEILDALGRGGLAEARLALARFREALDAHFSLEEDFYFPALHRHASGLSGELAELTRDHEALRAGFSDASRALAGLDGAQCSAALDAWLPRLAEHERREEQLLEQPAQVAL